MEGNVRAQQKDRCVMKTQPYLFLLHTTTPYTHQPPSREACCSDLGSLTHQGPLPSVLLCRMLLCGTAASSRLPGPEDQQALCSIKKKPPPEIHIAQS